MKALPDLRNAVRSALVEADAITRDGSTPQDLWAYAIEMRTEGLALWNAAATLADLVEARRRKRKTKPPPREQLSLW